MRSEDGRFEASQLEIFARPPLATREKEVAHFVSMRREQKKKSGKKGSVHADYSPPHAHSCKLDPGKLLFLLLALFFGLIRALPRSDRVVLQRPPLLGRPVVEGEGEGAKGQKTQKLPK